MSHIALYRSWRPRQFADIVGQEHIIQTLRNSLAEGRFTHAYLFNGPRGTGKTSAAKILAKAVNCLNGPAAEPCNECEACRRISDGSVMDVIELDAASNNGVDEIRDIRDKVKYAPTEVRYKVYIIDEVHMLTIGAFNALLKTLEEPPAHVIFILATTEPHKLPVTIISRCQRYDFRRISIEAQLDRLRQICAAEGIDADERALRQIAKLSDGGMRDALSLLDQIIAFTGSAVTYDNVVAITGSVAVEQFEQLADAVVHNELGQVLNIVEQLMYEGKSAEKCLENFIYYYRDVLMVKLLPSPAERGESAEEGLVRIAAAYGKEQLFQAIELLNRAASEVKYAAHPGTMFEVALMQLCTQLHEAPSERANREATTASAVSASVAAAKGPEWERLERRLAELEAKVAAGATGSGGTSSAGGSAQRASGGGARAIRSSSSGAAGGLKIKVALDEFVKSQESSFCQQIRPKWSNVLANVKSRNISLNAWLINGELVSATEDAVLIAFKNSIHRETTEKPDNRQVIEQVMGEVLGREIGLRTTMLKDWTDALADGGNGEKEQPELLELLPEDMPEGRHREEWINEAIDLFGEDMVVIKED
jgi:DNA polymerase-3 subunit gamma/tau